MFHFDYCEAKAKHDILGASEVSANLNCNSRTSALGRLRDYLRFLMGRTLYADRILCIVVSISIRSSD